MIFPHSPFLCDRKIPRLFFRPNGLFLQFLCSQSQEDLAKDIIAGEYGYGHATREKKLAEEGWLDFYTYEEIRNKNGGKIKIIIIITIIINPN